MNKKQQKNWNDIRILLLRRYSEDETRLIYDEALFRWNIFAERMQNESENRKRQATDIILPRVALYAALKEKGYPADEILAEFIQKFIGPQMHARYAKMEKIPGFFTIYRKIFTRYTDKSDWWECCSTNVPNGFKVDITKCLWKECCDIAGYPEVCRYFCDCDDITYGGLDKIEFRRTQTLGKGGKSCDFEFFRKR